MDRIVHKRKQKHVGFEWCVKIKLESTFYFSFLTSPDIIKEDF
jgi:hypothetical protein